MSFTATANTTFTFDGVSTVIKKTTYTGDSKAETNFLVAAGTTQIIDLPFPVDTLVAFEMKSTKNVHVATNASDGTGGNLFDLVANIGMEWTNDSPLANPLTHAVTKFYVTNAGLVDATFEVRALYNAHTS